MYSQIGRRDRTAEQRTGKPSGYGTRAPRSLGVTADVTVLRGFTCPSADEPAAHNSRTDAFAVAEELVSPNPAGCILHAYGPPFVRGFRKGSDFRGTAYPMWPNHLMIMARSVTLATGQLRWTGPYGI